ncbi:hypothetical protein I350_03789 [Cryptococcus amylolentus CBS 6273]|uniref:Uncharacterized protein n=1 Tax=Cryptococcus amylolentus CBS 6273 TaxID=1296118 RepID=A0A1E3K4X2_9TREE|nr:hypothetical protein I350_03789 [Cryptococcus amylolentus CBS 6273]
MATGTLRLSSSRRPSWGSQLRRWYSMPVVPTALCLADAELDVDTEAATRHYLYLRARDNGDQLGAINEVVNCVDSELGKIMLLDGRAGTGKTAVECTAYSRRRTAHPMFEIPF